MYGWFLKLSRANPKARVLATLMAFACVMNIWHAWSGLHDSLVVARWVAWITTCSALVFLPMLLVISLGGRMPNTFARRIPGALRMTPQELHAAIQADLIKGKQRSREL
ncbi:MAG TPA: hypothetical protein VGC19_05405 [Rhodanobacter sp.]